MNKNYLVVLTGIAAGLLSGLFGLGGGIIVVPMLVYMLGMTQHEAQGTSLAMMLPPIGILAVWAYYQAGAVNWTYGLIIALGFVLGGFIGAKLSLRLPQKQLKKVFAFFLILIALKMLL
jgi:uncharacterized membrane protein YfcA